MACRLKEGGKKCNSYLAKIAMDLSIDATISAIHALYLRMTIEVLQNFNVIFLVFPMLTI